MSRVAAIDIGTFTMRLAIADVADGRVQSMRKQSTIVNLGQDVDATGMLALDAMKRAFLCARAYAQMAKEADCDALCCTLTSAARDAGNSDELMAALSSLGITPEVIPGEIEGALTFLGVAQDFPSTPILVADNGGGSTELALGKLEGRVLDLRWVKSVDVGCRRVTDRFFTEGDPVGEETLSAAHAFARGEFDRALATMPRDLVPERLVVCGGTATSLIAMVARLEPYNPAFVHLHELTAGEIRALEQELSALPVEKRKALPGLQEKRAPVILGGTVAVAEILASTGFDVAQASESDLLFGLSIACDAAVSGAMSPVVWKPAVSRLVAEG
ncbi:MAG: phosphatase [Atopobiaceae bacterium]|nr:phosphatase [Atopobiaceae bacterium]